MSELMPDPPLAGAALDAYRAGLSRQQAGALPEALRHLQNALRLAGGEHPDILEALAVLAGNGGDLPAAERIFRRVLELRPSARAAFRFALVLSRRQSFAEAVTWFERALAQVPLNPDAEDAYAFALESSGQYERGLAVRERVLRLAPSGARAVALAATLLRRGDHERLADALPGLLAAFPDEPGLLEAWSATALGKGDYATGFSVLARRRAALKTDDGDPRLRACAAWDGTRFDGTLLVSLENHAGEELMLSPVLERIAALGQRAIIEVDVRLLPLFRRTWPSLGFVARGSGELAACVRAGESYRRTASLDLMRLSGRTFTLPGPRGWLRADPVRVAAIRSEYRARWPGRKLAGLSWRSARAYNGMEAKSVPLAALPLTLALPGVAWISLQYGDVAAEFDAAPRAPWLDGSVDAWQDFEALAAQIAALDLVVTVSNITAHFAGALGVPAIVLLPRRFPVLWHWGYTGDACTWYESVRLLRNPDDSGWAEVDRLLAEDLAGAGRLAGPDSRLV